MSKACEAALKTAEREISQTGLGQDALSRFSHFKSSDENATSRLIRTACDCLGPKGDEKSGCQTEWQGYCNTIEKQLKMTSYRSNRFNCYFGAAATIFHQEDIDHSVSSRWYVTLKPQTSKHRSRPARPKAGHPPVCCSSALLQTLNQSYRTLVEAVAE